MGWFGDLALAWGSGGVMLFDRDHRIPALCEPVFDLVEDDQTIYALTRKALWAIRVGGDRERVCGGYEGRLSSREGQLLARGPDVDHSVALRRPPRTARRRPTLCDGVDVRRAGKMVVMSSGDHDRLSIAVVEGVVAS